MHPPVTFTIYSRCLPRRPSAPDRTGSRSQVLEAAIGPPAESRQRLQRAETGGQLYVSLIDCALQKGHLQVDSAACTHKQGDRFIFWNIHA